MRPFESFLEEFIDGESDGLPRGDAHDARRNALVEGARTFLLEHVSRDSDDLG